MRRLSVPSADVRRTGRLDADYWSCPGVAARRTVAAGPTRPINGEVHRPPRLTRIPAVRGEASLPYLQPHGMFDYPPQPQEHLSAVRQTDVDTYRVGENTILLTRSGRNLGDAVFADADLRRFMFSDDLLQIRMRDFDELCVVFAFLRTERGRAVLRHEINGSVIDHIDPPHVEAVRVPVLPAGDRARVVGAMGEALRLRERARRTLRDSAADYNRGHHIEPTAPLWRGWSIRSAELRGRLDAAYFDPAAARAQDTLRACGGERVGDGRTVSKPNFRQRIKTAPSDAGRVMLSGTHLLQHLLIAPKRVFLGDPALAKSLTVRAGEVAFPADGRVEGSLGVPVIVTGRRDGWLASGHVARVRPRDRADAGHLWLAFSCEAVRRQLLATACGSVQDALYPEDVGEVVIPPPPDEEVCIRVAAAWEQFAEAEALEDNARAVVNHAVDSA